MGVLDKLWQLQRVLTELAEKERILTEKPEDFAEVDTRYQEARSQMSGLEEGVKTLNLERKKIDGELQAAQETLKKYQGQLMLVKNQQQYSAAWKEIDTTRKIVKEYEDAELAKMAAIEDLEGNLKTLTGEHADLTSEWEAAHQRWQDSLAEVKAEVDTIRTRAEGLEEGIPPGPLRQFKRVMEQRQGIGVSLVESGGCSICRFKVRSQAILDLKRGEMITCEGCRRLLYVESTG